MGEQTCEILYVGGPTAVVEYGGLRFLTDPTFDHPGLDYITGPVTCINPNRLRHRSTH